MATGTTAAAPVGRVAVITGSNKGIGFYIALQLGMSGLFRHIVLACRDTARAQVAVSSIQEKLAAAKGGGSGLCDVLVSSEPLILGDFSSHQQLAQRLSDRFQGRIDVLVNNAAFAYKNADPTPFRDQCGPTLDVNFRGTVDLTERLMPLLRRGQDRRLVNVASVSGRLNQLAPFRRQQFSDPNLTMQGLKELVDEFERSVKDGNHSQKGWSNSNYGISKLAVIAATRVWAREEHAHAIIVNACCPGYCKTDMTSQQGTRNPADGAKNAVLPATMKDPPTGQFFSNYQVSEW